MLPLSVPASVKTVDVLLSIPEGLRVRAVMQEVLEAQMEEALVASKGDTGAPRLPPRIHAAFDDLR